MEEQLRTEKPEQVAPGTHPTDDSGKTPGKEAHTRLRFWSGLFAGAALSLLVPWEALGDIAAGARLGALALLSAGFALFRILTARRGVRQASAIGMVILGGFLLAAGSRLPVPDLRVLLVSTGAGAFLCGITLLLRERRAPGELREAAIGRVVEDLRRSSENDGPTEVARIESLRLLETTHQLNMEELAESPRGDAIMLARAFQREPSENSQSSVQPLDQGLT